MKFHTIHLYASFALCTFHMYTSFPFAHVISMLVSFHTCHLYTSFPFVHVISMLAFLQYT